MKHIIIIKIRGMIIIIIIVKYFDISLIDIIKMIFAAKLDKRNYPIWDTQNSNNSCEYRLLLSDGLSLLMNKLPFNSNKYLLGSLPRNLKSSCTTLWSQTSMWSLTEVDKVPLTGLPVLGETPWCSETLTLKCL